LSGNFFSGFFSGGIGGEGGEGLGGLAKSAGTTLKYTALYGALGLLQQGISQVVAEMLNFEDSNTNLAISLEGFNTGVDKSGKVTQDFVNDLSDIAIVAGSNVGDVMDIASLGIRAFGDEVQAAGGDVVQFGTEFAAEAQKMAIIANTTVVDAAGNIRAAVSGFDLGPKSLSRISDAVTNAKQFGGDPEDISQGLASFAEGASAGGLSPELAAALVARVTGASDRTGQAVGTSLTRILAITGGSAGQSALASVNRDVAANRAAKGEDPGAAAIDLSAKSGPQIIQLAKVYDELTDAQKKLVNNQIAGTNSSREFTAALKFLSTTNESSATITNAAGKAADEQAKRLKDLTARVREFKGAISAVLTQLSESGVLAPLLGGFAALTKALEAFAKLLEVFNGIPKKAREIAFSLAEVAVALKLINGLVAEGGLKGYIGGLGIGKARTATATAEQEAEVLAQKGALGSVLAGAAPVVAPVAPAAGRQGVGAAFRSGFGGLRLPGNPEPGTGIFRKPIGSITGAEFKAAGAEALEGGATAAGAALSALVNPVTLAIGGLVAIGAIKGKVSEFGTKLDEADAANQAFASAGSQVGTDASKTRLVDLQNFTSQGASAAKALDKSNNSILGKVSQNFLGGDTNIDQSAQELQNEVQIAKNQIADIKANQAKALNSGNVDDKLAIFGDPAAISVDSLVASMEELTKSGASAAERLDLLNKVIDVTGTGAAPARTVNASTVAQAAVARAALLDRDPVARKIIVGGINGAQESVDNPLVNLFSDPTIAGNAQTALQDALPKTITDKGGKLSSGQKSTATAAAVKVYIDAYRARAKALGISINDQLSDDAIAKEAAPFLQIALNGNVTSVAAGGTKLSGELLTGLIDQVIVPTLQAKVSALLPGDDDGTQKAYAEAIASIKEDISNAAVGADLTHPNEVLASLEVTLAESQISEAEKVRAAAQKKATSAKQYAAIGNAFLKKNLVLAAEAGDITALIALMNEGSTENIKIARKVLSDKLKVDQAKAANAKKQAAAIALASVGGSIDNSDEAKAYNDEYNHQLGSSENSDIFGAVDKDKKGLKAFDKAQSEATPSETGKGSATFDPRFLERAIEKRDAFARQDAALDQANRALSNAQDDFDQYKKKDDVYYQKLSALNQAKANQAAAQEAATQTTEKLNIDLTNPVQVADEELAAAKRRTAAAVALASDPKNVGKGKTFADQAGADAFVNEARLNEATSQNSDDQAHQQNFLTTLQAADKYRRISHQAYLSGLNNEAKRVKEQLDALKSTDQGREQLQLYYDSLLDAAKSSADELAGQFNLGDIKVPTVYQVRSLLNSRDDTGSILGANSANSTAGNVVNDSSTKNVVLNGVPLGQVLKVLEELFGKKVRTNVARRY
jgi:hypothetical protein